MRLLLFGAHGQFGTELMQWGASHCLTIVAAARSDADIADSVQVGAKVSEARPHIIVNAAGYTKVDRAETEPEEAFRANRDGPAVLAAVAQAHGLPLVHLSTDFIFDGKKQSAYVEDDLAAPINSYGKSKWEGEEAVRLLCDRHIIIRTSWLFGRFGTNFLKTILKLANERDMLAVVADQMGTPTCTVDLAEGVLNACHRAVDDDRVWGTYHFAGHGHTTWHGFASEIVAAQSARTGMARIVKPISTAEYPLLAKRPANSRLNSDRFASTFGIRARPWQLRTREVVGALVGSKGKP